MWALSSGYTEPKLVEILLTHGADPNRRDKTGLMSAMGYAKAPNQPEMIRLLKKAGAKD